MKGYGWIIGGLVAVLAAVTLALSAFIVTETEQVFITQFGKPIGKPITKPGMHFKVPFLQKARYFEKRFLAWDGRPNQVPTGDKLYISIDTYARWRISDPLLFFQKVRTYSEAQARLDSILDGETRSAVAAKKLDEIIRSRKRDARVTQEPSDEMDLPSTLVSFQYGRSLISSNIVETARPKLQELGIELLDLRFKRINYSQTVQERNFQRMISERNLISEKYRSEGREQASKILGQKEADLKQIQSDAFRQAETIKGQADAEAVVIYARAYNQSEEARDFYQFLKTLESYETTVTTNDSLILSTKSDFYQYLRGATPNPRPRPSASEAR